MNAGTLVALNLNLNTIAYYDFEKTLANNNFCSLGLQAQVKINGVLGANIYAVDPVTLNIAFTYNSVTSSPVDTTL